MALARLKPAHADPSRIRPVAIANYDLRASGTVLKSIEIAEALAAEGVPAELWVIRNSGALKDRVPPNVPVVRAGTREPLPGGRSVELGGNIPALAAKLRRRPPSVLLSGGNHFHLPARLALQLSGRRGDVRLGFRASNSSRRPDHDGDLTEPGLLDRMKYAGADFIAAVSSELADEVRSLGVGASISAIPNGVDLARVRALAEEPFDHPFLSGDMPTVASVGRIARQKGFDLAIRVLALLPNVRLLIVGDGEAEYVGELLALAGSLGVAGRVAFLGFQANPFAIIARCDAYVSASRWEGASNSLLEALAIGLPLIATDAPTGNREILGGGANGTLAPVEDPEGLAEAIARELDLGRDRAAQRSAAEAFDIRLCLARWVDLLRDQRLLALEEHLRAAG
jgi:glycosyltransferase involved in cell wall biosynthesis